jgi:hypothetical protein
MTPAEMECCKKMAGDCDMGGGDHKCCDKTVNHAAPTAVIANNVTSHMPALLMLVIDDRLDVPERQVVNEPFSFLTARSLSPPGFSNVLRI